MLLFYMMCTTKCFIFMIWFRFSLMSIYRLWYRTHHTLYFILFFSRKRFCTDIKQSRSRYRLELNCITDFSKKHCMKRKFFSVYIRKNRLFYVAFPLLFLSVFVSEFSDFFLWESVQAFMFGKWDFLLIYCRGRKSYW